MNEINLKDIPEYSRKIISIYIETGCFVQNDSVTCGKELIEWILNAIKYSNVVFNANYDTKRFKFEMLPFLLGCDNE